jgi:hypothetical protein
MSKNFNKVFCIRPNEHVAIEGIYRIVFEPTSSNKLYMFRIFSSEESEERHRNKKRQSVKLPLAIFKQSLNNAISTGAASEIQVERKKSFKKPKLTARNQSIYIRNSRILKYLTAPANLQEMFELDEWALHIGAIAHQEKVAQNTVRRLLTKYFEIGMDEEEACQPAFTKSGTPRIGFRKTTRKLGRRNHLVSTGHNENAAGVNSEEYIEQITLFLKSRATDITKSTAQLYREFRDKFAPKIVSALADGTLVKHNPEHREFITQGQFSYRCKTIIGDVELYKARQGIRKTNLRHRTILGSARERINFPGHTYIFDSTIADVYLVSAYDRTKLIGRPVIYVVIDAFSSLIVGLRITLAGPNFDEARTALYHGLNDKSAWLNWLNLEGMHENFPRACRPSYVFADRGEFHSKTSREHAMSLQFSMEIAAPYRADWKSLVERMFKILNEKTIHWVPGAVRERVKERGNRDVRLDAVLTLYEFTRIIAIECGRWNAYQDMNKHISASMFSAEIDATPIGFWKWGLENLHASPYFFDKSELIQKCLNPVPATINRKGIFASGNYYVANWMKDHPDFERATFSKPTYATLFLDPDDPVSGYCTLGRRSEVHQVKRAFRNYPNDSYTHEDIVDFLAINKLKYREQRLTTEDEESALRILQTEIVASASEATRISNQARPRSKSVRVKDIKQNRKDEILSRSGESSVESDTAFTMIDTKVSPGGSTSFSLLLTDEIDKWTT